MKEAGYMLVFTFETNGGTRRVLIVPPSKEPDVWRLVRKKDWFFVDREVRFKVNADVIKSLS